MLFSWFDFVYYFFFSSRRRHTRSVSAFLLNRSSDLGFRCCHLSLRRKRSSPNVFEMAATETITSIILIKLIRVSLGKIGERRVGKECRSRSSPYHLKKKNEYKGV